MNFNLGVYSTECLNGQLKFDIDKLQKFFCENFCGINTVKIEKFDEQKIGEDIQKIECDSVIFCPNASLDKVIIDNIQHLGNDKMVVDDEAVVFKTNGHKIIFLPIENDYLSLMNKIKFEEPTQKRCQFHLFGKTISQVNNILNGLKSQFPELDFYVRGDNLLIDVYLSYEGQDSFIDDTQVKIASAFQDCLYSENNLILEQIIFQLLRLKNNKLALNDSLTGGQIISALYDKNQCFNEVLGACKIVPGVMEITCENVYDGALAMIKETGADVIVSIYGKYENGVLNTIYAIGDLRTINIYKSSFKTEYATSLILAKNALLFNLMKKLRQNDFAF